MISASSASARQPPTEAQVRAWLEREIEASKSFPSLGEVGIRWREEDFNQLSQADIESLRALVSKVRDHPRSEELRRADREREQGPFFRTFLVFTDSKDRWRTASFPAEGPTKDACIAGERVWSRFGGKLTVYKPSHANEPSLEAAAVPRAYENVFVPTLSYILDGGLHVLGRVMDSRVTSVRVSGDRWEAMLVKDPPIAHDVRLEGRWDPRPRRGFIERRTLAESGYSPESKGSYATFTGWSYNENLERWVCGEVNHFHADGKRWRRLLFEGAVPMPEGGWDAITRIPDGKDTDPLRGEVVLRTVRDFRTSEIAKIGEDGSLRVVGEIPPMVRDEDRYAWLRPVGWVMIPVSLMVFVIVRHRRAS